MTRKSLIAVPAVLLALCFSGAALAQQHPITFDDMVSVRRVARLMYRPTASGSRMTSARTGATRTRAAPRSI
jgi:hypothetical protein